MFKRNVTILGVPVLFLVSACAEPAPQPVAWAGGPITDEATFRQEIVGRPITLDNDSVSARIMFGADGAFSAVATSPDGRRLFNRLEGTWSFRDGQFCRDFEVVEGASNSPPSECAPVSKTGNIMTVTTSRGTQNWTVGDV